MRIIWRSCLDCGHKDLRSESEGIYCNQRQRVIGVAQAPLPTGSLGTPVSCDQCCYWRPVFLDACQGTCVNAWSDHVDETVFLPHSCSVFSQEYDETLDSQRDAAWSFKR